MCQKWEGDCGLWILNEIIFKRYAESLKKIVGAVWELPAKWAPTIFFQTFSTYFLNHFIKNPQTTNTLPFLTHNISAIGGVHPLEIPH